MEIITSIFDQLGLLFYSRGMKRRKYSYSSEMIRHFDLICDTGRKIQKPFPVFNYSLGFYVSKGFQKELLRIDGFRRTASDRTGHQGYTSESMLQSQVASKDSQTLPTVIISSTRSKINDNFQH